MSQDDSVWAETTDGGLLKQLFGYYPTLHDAVLVSVDLNRASDSIALVVDYTDMVGDDSSQNLSTRIQLLWTGIESFDLPLGMEDLYGLDFGRRGDKIVTNLEMWPGVFGSVVSESVEATLVQLDPGDPPDTPRIRYQ